MATINELEAAIAVLESGEGEVKTATVLEALQDARRREEGCDQCNGSKCDICKKVDSVCCSGCNDFFRFEPERFCKHCGRALRGENEERE